MDTPAPMNGAVLRTRTHSGDHRLVSFFLVLWRRKRIPLLGFAAGIGLGLLGLLVTPPLYRASSQVMIEAGPGVLKSEVEIMESVPVLSKVAGTMGLYRDPEFNTPRIYERLLAGSDDNALRDRVLGRLSHMVDVRLIPGTGIVDMSVRNRNPEKAAQIANALLAAYQERKVDERFEQSRQMSIWMNKRLEGIKAQAEDAKQKLGAYEIENGLMDSADLKVERLSVLNRALGQAQEEISSLSSRLEQARKGQGASALDDVLKSDRINALKKYETRLLAQMAEMRSRYGNKHPKMIAQRAELKRVRQELARETTNYVAAINQDLAVAQTRVAALQTQINEAATSADSRNHKILELRNLESDVSATERLYGDFLVKYQDMMAASEMRAADIKVISMATIPSRPDMDMRIKRILCLGLSGLVLGLIFVVLRIALNTGFTTTQQLEGMTGYPVFAAVPMASLNGTAVHHNVVQDPAAILAESLRSLRVSLRLRGETGKRPRVISFTSTLPDEGKTSLAVMLGMIAAKSGERVCVVDCDLRRPSLHKAFGIGNARGVADYLSDRLSADEVIYRKDPSGVHLITAKPVPSHSLTLLTSGRMERLIESLREQYDLVLLDAPSSLAFADARVLARMVDQTLYVVAWNRTRRESVLASLKAYADMHYADLALVLNKVDLNEYLRDSAAAVIYQYGHDNAVISPA